MNWLVTLQRTPNSPHYTAKDGLVPFTIPFVADSVEDIGTQFSFAPRLFEVIDVQEDRKPIR